MQDDQNAMGAILMPWRPFHALAIASIVGCFDSLASTSTSSSVSRASSEMSIAGRIAARASWAVSMDPIRQAPIRPISSCAAV
ncbi:MAG: hypothetical protein JW395_3784 [Nitrospira sp.]|nr:hypothetical protein [Nitrospira sp.]